MKSLSFAIILALWGICLYGVLQVGSAPENHEHSHESFSACGPWGCGSPVRALAAMHAFWLMFVTLPVGLLIRTCSPKLLKAVGLGLMAAGISGLIGLGLYEALTWLPGIPNGRPTYFVQRFLFSVATLTDVPLAPIAFGGVALFIAGVIKSRTASLHDATVGGEKQVSPNTGTAPNQATTK